MLHSFSRPHLRSCQSAVLLIVAGLAIYGSYDYQRRQAEEQRQGEAARQQVLMALRITNHALDHMNRQLAAHHHANQE